MENYYIVTITNGVVEDEISIRKDGDWVRDVQSAERMAKSRINSAWSVVEGRTKEI